MPTQRERGKSSQAKRLFVTDLDGTLLNDDKRIALEDLAALARLRQLGVLVAVATGRSDYSFAWLVEQLAAAPAAPAHLPADYIIFSTGAGIMDFPGRNLLQSFSLGPADVRLVAEVLDSLHLDYMVHQPVPDTRNFFYRLGGAGDNPDFQRRLRLYNGHATPLSPVTLAASPGATQFLCIAGPEAGHRIAGQLAARLGQFSVIKATSPLDGQSIWIEIFAPAVSKSQAVKWLARELGIARQQICAVGNDYNDEDLLGWAGQGFAMANSPASILARFPVVASNNYAGVSRAAGRWLGLEFFRYQ